MIKAKNIAAYIIFYTVIVWTFLIIFPTQALAGKILLVKIYEDGQVDYVGSYDAFAPALNAASDGMTLLCEGSFVDNIAWKASLTNITIKASTETSLCTLEMPPVIGNHALYFGPSAIDTQCLTIEGFTIKNYSYAGDGAAILVSTDTSTNKVYIWLKDCIVYNCVTTSGFNGGVYCAKGASAANHRVFAENCAFVRNRAGNEGGVAYKGIWVTKNCTFISNEAGPTAPGGAIASNATWTATNDVYSGNLAPGTNYYANYNRLFYYTWSAHMNYCYIQPDGIPSSDYLRHILSGEAGIRSMSLNDPNFGKLKPHSPLIDSGTIEPAIGDDILHQFRPHGFSHDIGAYEFQGPSVNLIWPSPANAWFLNDSTVMITWKVSDEYGFPTDRPITIRYSSDEGQHWFLVTNEANTDSYEWTVPAKPTLKGLISIEAINTSNEGNYDVSSYVFQLLSPHDLYVSPSGSDSNSGTISSPLKTIQCALDFISEGNTIFLFGGTYKGVNNRNLHWPNKNWITLKATMETAIVTVDAEKICRIIDSIEAVTLTIEGITLQNGWVTKESKLPYGGGVVFMRSPSNLWLKNVTVKNCSAEVGSDGDGGAFSADEWNGYIGNGAGRKPNLYAENCVFSGNKARRYGGVTTCINLYAKNCLFNNNSSKNDYGVARSYVNFGNQYIWYYTLEAQSCSFINNTSPSYGVGKEIYPLSLQNCLFMGNGTYTIHAAYAKQVNYCAFDYDHPYSAGVGNITLMPTMEPSLVSVSPPYNFRPAQNSRYIDAGTNTDVPPKDITGFARPHGYMSDIGAYEFKGPSVTLQSPTGGERLLTGEAFPIVWFINDEYGLKAGLPISVEYSADNGAHWTTLLQSSEACKSGSVVWVTPVIPSRQCKIRMTVVNSSSEVNYATSGTFSVLLRNTYVDATYGNDSFPGTIGSPVKTIQLGLNYVTDNGSVHLNRGRYQGAGNRSLIWPASANITLKPSNESCVCTIDALSADRFIKTFEAASMSVSITIEGITLTNCGTRSVGGDSGHGGVALLPPNFTLYLNKVTVRACSPESYSNGGAFAGIAEKDPYQPGDHYYRYPKIYATNCHFDNNEGGYYGGVFYDCQVKAVNTLFTANRADVHGAILYSEHLVSNVTFEATNCIFVRNRVSRDAASGGYGYIYWYYHLIYDIGTGLRAKFKNSVLWDNSTYGNIWNLPNHLVTVEYCDVQNYERMYWRGGQGNISAEPMFISANNFHTANGSPLIDAGTNVGAPSFDFDNQKRPLGLSTDIGIYETTKPRVRVIKPNGGEQYSPGYIVPIQWSAGADYGFRSSPNPIKISYKTGPSDSTWYPITTTTEAYDSISWEAPAFLSGAYLISVEVTDTSGESASDNSDAGFAVLNSEVYVSPTLGNDNLGNGMFGFPFRTIRKALSMVRGGGTVFMKAGTYLATDTGGYGDAANYNIIWPDRSGITLKATPETALCTVDAMGAGRLIRVVTRGIGLTIEGITMKGGRTATALDDGMVAGGGILISTSEVKLHLRNVQMYHCTAETTNGQGGAVACWPGSLSGANTNMIYATNCIFAGNIAGYGGVALSGQWRAINCAFVDNKTVGGAYGDRGGVGYQGLWGGANCIFAQNSGGAAGSSVMGLVSPLNFTYSNVQADGVLPFASTWGTSNNISKEPGFLSTVEAAFPWSVYDLNLRSNSPCINRGTGGVGFPAYDLNYTPRPVGGVFDMGPYEYTGFSVRLISPSAGDRFDLGSPIVITYSAFGGVGTRVTPGPISLYFRGGTSDAWQVITSEVANTGTYDWTLPSELAYNCWISVEAVSKDEEHLMDCNTAAFYISPPITGIVTNERTGFDYPSIQAALHPAITNELISGDTLECFGLFTENLVWPNIDSIRLKGFGTANTILNGQGARGIYSANALNIIIEGFLIKNCHVTGGNGAGINLASGSHLLLDRDWIKTCSVSGLGDGGAVYAPGSVVEARNCIFSNNSAENKGGAVTYGGDWRVTNCTFYGNQSPSGASIAADYDSWQASNSIISGNESPLFRKDTTTTYPKAKYTDMQVTGGGWPYLGSGNISEEPLFISTPEGINQDLSVMSNSPCIDSGTSEGATLYDIDLAPRPMGDGFDMGAFEQMAFATDAPSIEAVYVNGVRFNSGDIISYNVNMRVLCSSKSGLDSLALVIDGDYNNEISFSGPVPPSKEIFWGSWSGSFNLPAQSDSVKSHTFLFKLKDKANPAHEANPVLTGTTMAGSVQIIGIPLNYPNPFKPLSSDPGMNTTNIQYTLSTDAPVTVLIYDISGHEVKRIVSPAGINGGRAGINSVQWNGHSLFGETVGNGMYVYLIVSGNKVIGSSKLVVYD